LRFLSNFFFGFGFLRFCRAVTFGANVELFVRSLAFALILPLSIPRAFLRRQLWLLITIIALQKREILRPWAVLLITGVVINHDHIADIDIVVTQWTVRVKHKDHLRTWEMFDHAEASSAVDKERNLDFELLN
jgi:hypothetical protein